MACWTPAGLTFVTGSVSMESGDGGVLVSGSAGFPLYFSQRTFSTHWGVKRAGTTTLRTVQDTKELEEVSRVGRLGVPAQTAAPATQLSFLYLRR